MLRVYNTLTRTKEPLSRSDGKGRHLLSADRGLQTQSIGHMVGPVIFDAIKRYLTYLGHRVAFDGVENHRADHVADMTRFVDRRCRKMRSEPFPVGAGWKKLLVRVRVL